MLGSNRIATLDEAAVLKYLDSSAGPVLLDLLARGRAVQAEAVRLVHKKTHALADSIEVKVSRQRNGRPWVTVGSTLPYANVQEFDMVRGRSYLRASLHVAYGKSWKRNALSGAHPIRAHRNTHGRVQRFSNKQRQLRATRQLARALQGKGPRTHRAKP
jgi:hypothetical protein